MSQPPSPRVSRRTLVRTSLWSMPAVAIAIGTPAASASTTTAPTGITAATPAASTIGFLTNVVGNRVAAFDLGVVPAIDTSSVDTAIYGVTAIGSISAFTLTTNTGTTYTSSAHAGLVVSLGSAAAPLAAPSFTNVEFPSGTYIQTSNPVRFVSVSAPVTLVFSPTDRSPNISSTYLLTWNLSLYGVGVVAPSFLGGAGTIRYSGGSITAA